MKLSIVNPAHKSQSGRRADTSHEHVLLRIPGIALSAEKRVCGCAGELSHGPFKQFVAGADCQANAENYESQPFAAVERRSLKQNFPSENGRDKSLSEMAKPIIIISPEVKVIANPVEERFLRVGVMTSDHQDDRVN